MLQQLFELLLLRRHVDLNTCVSPSSASDADQGSPSLPLPPSNLGSSLFYLPYLLDAHVPASCPRPLEYEAQFCECQHLQFFPQRSQEVEQVYAPLRSDVLRGRICSRWMLSGVYTVPKGRRLLERAFHLLPEPLSSSLAQAFFSSSEILQDLCASVDAALADYDEEEEEEGGGHRS